MLASRTVEDDKEIIYYKNSRGNYINAIDGSVIENVPDKFNITCKNLDCVVVSNPTSSGASLNYEKDEVGSGTYLIGTYIFDRNTNNKYNGELTTKLIMKASKTIEGNTLDDMVIYYKNSRGNYIDAINGNALQEINEKFKVTNHNLIDFISLVNGTDFNSKITNLVGGKENVRKIVMADTLPNDVNYINLSSGDKPIYAYYNSTNSTVYIYSEGIIFLNEDSSNLLSGFSNLTDIKAFTNWNDSNAENMNNMFSGCSNLTDLTPLSKWEQIKYTVIFDSNGGSSVSNQIIPHGSTATKPSDPVKDGYRFIGWQLNGNSYSFTSVVAENITLTAKWEQIKYTVTFDSNGGSSVNSQIIPHGGTAIKPSNPNKVGYTFVEWQLNGNSYNFTNKVIENITLTAKWEQIRYTISINNVDNYSPDKYLTVYENGTVIAVRGIAYSDGTQIACTIDGTEISVAYSEIQNESQLIVTLSNGDKVIANID